MEESRASRDYLVGRMLNEIHDIVRVLQLTSSDDDDLDNDLGRHRNAKGALEARRGDALFWLQHPAAPSGSTGETALRELLAQARRLAESGDQGDDLSRLIAEMESLLNSLTALRQQRLGDSPQALSIARSLQVRHRALPVRAGVVVGALSEHSEPIIDRGTAPAGGVALSRSQRYRGSLCCFFKTSPVRSCRASWRS